MVGRHHDCQRWRHSSRTRRSWIRSIAALERNSPFGDVSPANSPVKSPVKSGSPEWGRSVIVDVPQATVGGCRTDLVLPACGNRRSVALRRRTMTHDRRDRSSVRYGSNARGARDASTSSRGRDDIRAPPFPHVRHRTRAPRRYSGPKRPAMTFPRWPWPNPVAPVGNHQQAPAGACNGLITPTISVLLWLLVRSVLAPSSGS